MADRSLDPAASEPVGFDAVYGAQWLRMVRLATLTTGSQALAEEVVQDAFLQLHRAWDRVEHPEAWLRAAVVSGCRGWVRHQVLERRHAAAPADEVAPDDGVLIREVLARLRGRQRAAIVLRFYEGCSEAETAELLGCRPGTVKSLVSRGLERLRRELA